ncbi:hypothetical protein ABH926_002936 [Catenulispora sp. GP43]
MNEIIVRRATAADREAVTQLLADSWGTTKVRVASG